MVRFIPEGRFGLLIEVATRVFVARGYRLTQMSDVATELGVAKGTLYRYVETKEALFDAAVRFADGQVQLPETASLPWKTPEAGSTVAYIRARLAAEARHLELTRVLSEPAGPTTTASEFADVIRDLFQRVSRHRRALKLVDRCALDHPELTSLWLQQGRNAQVTLFTGYLKLGVALGTLRKIANIQLAARMVMETIALWAVHMPWNASPHAHTDEEVENAVVDLLVNAHIRRRPRLGSYAAG